VFRRSFWKSQKANVVEARQRQHRNPYVFNSIHRIRQRLGRHAFGSENLNSTSAGTSTVEQFAHNQGDSDPHVFEDPDYIVAPPPKALRPSTGRRGGLLDSLRSFSRSALDSFAYIDVGTSPMCETRSHILGREIDLEVGSVFNTAIARKDSTFPGAILAAQSKSEIVADAHDKRTKGDDKQ
jgi:hypothetical protein